MFYSRKFMLVGYRCGAQLRLPSNPTLRENRVDFNCENVASDGTLAEMFSSFHKAGSHWTYGLDSLNPLEDIASYGDDGTRV